MKTISYAVVALALGALPAAAESYRAINWLTVNRIAETEFEVILKAGASAPGVWCAASDYSWKRLGKYKKTDLIIKSAVGPSVTNPGRNGVVFTVDPGQLSGTPNKFHLVGINRAGESLSVGHAKMFCPLIPGPAYDTR
ncbi:MAG: hypothetical protein ABJI96_16020 [Paracoccaceae bacterium]